MSLKQKIIMNLRLPEKTKRFLLPDVNVATTRERTPCFLDLPRHGMTRSDTFGGQPNGDVSSGQ